MLPGTFASADPPPKDNRGKSTRVVVSSATSPGGQGAAPLVLVLVPGPVHEEAMITIALLLALQERDLFDYEGQKAAKDVKKVVLIGDAGTHGAAGNHEFVAGSLILARRIHKAYPNTWAVVHSSKNWPKDLSHADAVVVGLNHGGKAAKDPQIAAAVARGA